MEKDSSKKLWRDIPIEEHNLVAVEASEKAIKRAHSGGFGTWHLDRAGHMYRTDSNGRKEYIDSKFEGEFTLLPKYDIFQNGDTSVSKDVAIEIMGDMLGKRNIQLLDQPNLMEVREVEQELVILREERDEMYRGNNVVIEKILSVYAQEIVEYYGASTIRKQSNE